MKGSTHVTREGTLASARPAQQDGGDPDVLLRDALVTRMAGATSRRALWALLRPIRYGSGVTSYAEFNLWMQALGRVGTLGRMITPANRDRVGLLVGLP